ncbi:hypothetical protein DFH28DRAFT_1174003 [Melampsora americana]|nr:hypothetical protein DFH28DRAFT_1174003 [Melampsora americana]
MPGTRQLQRHQQILRSKTAEVGKKYKSFQRQVVNYLRSFPRHTPIACPTLEEVKSIPITDTFWDFGALTHPNEPWATDIKTQEGITAHLEMTHSEDELRRIARECRQLMKWAVHMDDKITKLHTTVFNDDDSIDTVDNRWIVEMVSSKKTNPEEKLSESKEVLRSLSSNLNRTYTRLWMRWNCKLETIRLMSMNYNDLPIVDEAMLQMNWNVLVENNKGRWEKIVQAPVIRAMPDEYHD